MKNKYVFVATITLFILVTANWSAIFSYIFPPKIPQPIVQEPCYYEGMEGKTFLWATNDGRGYKGKILKVDCDGNMAIEYNLDSHAIQIRPSRHKINGFVQMDF